MKYKSWRNNKGFTMVELLAVIAILGILAGIAIPSVFRYVKKSRDEAYDVMQKTIYEGAKNFVLDENRYLRLCSNGFENIENEDRLLEKLQYVEKLIDPADNSKQCLYKVSGCMDGMPAAEILPTYQYKVQIKCTGHENCVIYNDDGTTLTCDDRI